MARKRIKTIALRARQIIKAVEAERVCSRLDSNVLMANILIYEALDAREAIRKAREAARKKRT